MPFEDGLRLKNAEHTAELLGRPARDGELLGTRDPPGLPTGSIHNLELSPEQEDFTWLETAFCDVFLKRLVWFAGMDYEWRSGPKPEQGGFWVVLWSKDPQRLWWELREEFERRTMDMPLTQEAAPWLIWLSPR